MAKYTGAVRFGDGTLMYFVFQGTVDVARPQLFGTPEEAFAAWNAPAAVAKVSPANREDEDVAVMPYFMHGSDEVQFHSRANRNAFLITGPLSMEAADRESANDYPYWDYGIKGSGV